MPPSCYESSVVAAALVNQGVLPYSTLNPLLLLWFCSLWVIVNSANQRVDSRAYKRERLSVVCYCVFQYNFVLVVVYNLGTSYMKAKRKSIGSLVDIVLVDYSTQTFYRWFVISHVQWYLILFLIFALLSRPNRNSELNLTVLLTYVRTRTGKW